MQIAIYGRQLKSKYASEVTRFFSLLEKKGISPIIYEPFYEHIKSDFHISSESLGTFTDKATICKTADYILCLGGDGTILDAITWVGSSETPIMGVNFGRLGFLASISVSNIEKAIDSLLHGGYVIDRRNMLTIESNKTLFDKAHFALNEFTIQRSDTSSMITVHVYLNGQHLNSYWADGLIIATPTGSTGYSLSCGGPIIYPKSKNFVITPVAPHNLNVRPIVVSDDVVISLQVEGRSNRFLTTLDSRIETIDNSYEIAIKKAPFSAQLIRLNDLNFLNAIKDKLLWGEDLRN